MIISLNRVKYEYKKNKIKSQTLLSGLENKDIYLFGAGFLGVNAYKGLKKLNLKIKNFVDDSKRLQNLMIENVKIISKKTLLSRDLSNSLIIITIWHPNHKYMWTKKKLFKKHNKIVFHYYDLVRIFPKILTKFSMFNDGQDIIKNWDRVKYLYKILNDKKSKLYFSEYINWIVFGDFDAQKTRIDKNQYIPNGIFNHNKLKNVVDVGAFQGDTFIRLVRNKKLNLEKYIAIEPDKLNFKKLEKNIKPYKKILDVKSINKAVTNSNKPVYFANTGKESSSIRKSKRNNKKISKINSISIDDILKNTQNSLVAIDVEGHEQEVLSSSRNIISKANTIFAISIYHNQTDVLKFYDLFDKYKEKYNVYFRVHGHDFVDSILYFVPNYMK